MKTQYRKDANHDPYRCGKECRPGSGCWPLPASPARANLLYRIIEQHYPAFTAHLAAQGRLLPGYVQREFEDHLKCGRLEHGFLRVRYESCHSEHLVAFSCKRRDFCPSCGARRLKRVFRIDIETCRECGGAMKIIACIEDPVVIQKILDYLKDKAETTAPNPLPESRARQQGQCLPDGEDETAIGE